MTDEEQGAMAQAAKHHEVQQVEGTVGQRHGVAGIKLSGGEPTANA